MLRLREKRSVVVARQFRQELAQGGAGVTDQADLDGIAQADMLGLVIDLHTDGLPRLGQELDIGEAGTDDEQPVAGIEGLDGWAGADHANSAGGIGARIGDAVLA